jgi:hypothetical protein
MRTHTCGHPAAQHFTACLCYARRCIADAAKLLSTELYSKPSHFVLELVQNADDCSYAPGVEPRLLLVLFKGGSSSSSSSSNNSCNGSSSGDGQALSSPRQRRNRGSSSSSKAHVHSSSSCNTSSSSSSSSDKPPVGTSTAQLMWQPRSGSSSGTGVFVFGAPHSTAVCDNTPAPAAAAGLQPAASNITTSSSGSSSMCAGWFDAEALQGDALLVASNEEGFSAANVKALCDMSASTKKRQAGAFTGEKGARVCGSVQCMGGATSASLLAVRVYTAKPCVLQLSQVLLPAVCILNHLPAFIHAIVMHPGIGFKAIDAASEATYINASVNYTAFCFYILPSPTAFCRHWLQGNCSCLRGHIHFQQRLSVLF